jgi:DNA repair protein RadC
MNQLMVKSPRGRYVKAAPDDVLAAAALIHAQQLLGTNRLETPGAARSFFAEALRGRNAEVFCMITLCNRHRALRFREVFQGTIDGCSVQPREVVRHALADNAAAVIFGHNHPSAVAEPSQADHLITSRLKEALGLLDIRVLDHLIVGADRVTSLAEQGDL